MGKKKEWGENSKKVEGRQRKASARAEEKEKNARKTEDEFWKDAGDGAKSKTQKKREEQEQKKQEAAAKRLEARRLADEETKQMDASLKKGARERVGIPKVTQYQLRKQQEESAAKQGEVQKEKKAIERKEVAEEAYVAMVDHRNTNRDQDMLEAHNVEQAIRQLTVEEDEADRHPERRRKAAYLAFEERELERLKSEKPGLKQSQYRDMIFKLWQKSVDNPMNRV
ncbi:hypothetical protein BSKO_03448 [Bryopsis sp. KO-2023]|nr:hypothetical protein BSKO_03448 [Bryopsis sp. KO-2023]